MGICFFIGMREMGLMGLMGLMGFIGRREEQQTLLLHIVELVVVAVARHQLIVGAALHNLAVVQHADFI